MGFIMFKGYKNKALQATVSYLTDTNNTVYRSNTIVMYAMLILPTLLAPGLVGDLRLG